MKLDTKILILFFAFVLGSCNDFVDEPKPTSSIGVNDVFRTEEGVRSLFVGMYRRFRFFNDGIADDSEAIGAILNTWNVKGNDIIRPQFNWFVFEYRFTDRIATGRKVNLIWNEMYELINTSNIIIDRMKNAEFSDATKLIFTAEAKAIRGMAYHHLIREFAPAYSLGTNANGVPIYTEPAIAENVNTGNARATVGEVYSQIKEDLEFASTHLTTSRVEKWAINKNVADGLLARAYLYMGMYEKATEAAKSARTDWKLSPETYVDGFSSISSPEWIWGAEFSSDQTLYFGGFASFWRPAARYASFFVNKTLVDHFSETDVRNIFKLAPSLLPGKTWYNTLKFTPEKDFSEDLVLMRVGEMYLIEMEALARLGNETEAAALLFELQKNRDPVAVTSGNIGDPLIAEIMLERRKELYGEMGSDYIDARRLGLGLTRDVNHTTPITLVSGDAKYIYPIPQSELDSNPMINKKDQNL